MKWNIFNWLMSMLEISKKILLGFCYPKLILDDESSRYITLHGLNAKFSVDEEKLAFPVRTEFGEEDIFVVYPVPDVSVVEALNKYEKLSDLWDNLPKEVTCNKYNTKLCLNVLEMCVIL